MALTATLDDKDNPLSDTCYQTIGQIAKKLAVSSFLMARRGIYFACTCLVSKSHNENANIKQNPCDVMRLFQSLGGEVSIWPS